MLKSAKKIFPYYYSLLENENEPLFYKLQRYEVCFTKEEPLDTLLEIHNKALIEFQNEKKSLSTQRKKAVPNLLDLKIEISKKILEKCILCEWQCKVNRQKGVRGHCRVLMPRLSSEFLHFGEEPELIPSHTFFFSGCTFNCVFCQNYDISQDPCVGLELPPAEYAYIIEKRFYQGSQNVNWVGGEPTPNLAHILEVTKYVSVPIAQVWNSNMYMSELTMQILDGFVDLYLADFKYGNDDCAKKYSRIKNYFAVTCRNHKIANIQTEMIIRHLVMPNHVECCSIPVLQWITDNLDTTKIRVNVMEQYHPEYKAEQFPEINRRLYTSEFQKAWNFAEKLGLNLV